MQSTRLVIESTMHPERVRATTFEDAIIDLDSDGCEGKGHIVLVNAVSKLSSARSRAGEEAM